MKKLKKPLRASFVWQVTFVASISFSIGAVAANTNDLTISQKNRQYSPESITLKAGETVKIINDDIFLHHAFIESEKMEFDSGSMEEGESTVVKFPRPGKFQLKCAIHPKMNLDVTVK